MITITALLLALAIDRLVGWPDWLYRRLSHPVVAMGYLISWHDKRLNKTHYADGVRRLAGVVTVIMICGASLLVALIAGLFYTNTMADIILIALLAWPFIAAKSLKDHVRDVAEPLQDGDIIKARHAVSMIVGRNATQLDETAIARASIESLAENTSDGIIAPLFWGLIFGLPGLVVYKAINTMDSMIGYRNEKYHAFGWAAARLDDLANYLPARLTGLLYVLTSRRFVYALRVMVRDSAKHRSPNAGWPESALAASLDIRLSGPRLYDGVPSQDAWLHEEGAEPNPHDITKAVTHYERLLTSVMVIMLLCLVFSDYYGG